MGARVRLADLKAAGFNEGSGTLGVFDAHKDRWTVHLIGHDGVAANELFKAANLVVIEPAPQLRRREAVASELKPDTDVDGVFRLFVQTPAGHSWRSRSSLPPPSRRSNF